ncbi:MAG: hypothetical protein EOM67_05540, partial [Spirochaetia bacterium]|nr:hypothetical protein [Spirochaetia bacterium]
MAQKIQLVIETDAHMEGMEKAQRNLEQLGVAGQNANKIFKTSGNLDAYNEAIKRIYHTTGNTKDQVKAATSAFSAYHKAMTVAQERLGKGLSFGILSDDGLSTRLTKDIKEIGSYLSRTMNDVQMDTDNYRKSLTRDMP